jgi:hypothetical protein
LGKTRICFEGLDDGQLQTVTKLPTSSFLLSCQTSVPRTISMDLNFGRSYQEAIIFCQVWKLTMYLSVSYTLMFTKGATLKARLLFKKRIMREILNLQAGGASSGSPSTSYLITNLTFICPTRDALNSIGT